MPESLAQRAARLAGEPVRQAAHNARFLAQLLLALGWIWRNVARPVLRFLRRPVTYLWRRYRALWDHCVYQNGRFSRARAGLMLLATWAFVWYLLLDTIDLVWDAGLYTLTARVDEHVYLNSSQQIDNWTGAHAIEGWARPPFSDDDAIYFRTSGGWFNQLWSLSHGKGLFFPEYVGAAVPTGISKCVVTTYGIRLRLLNRINQFPDLLAVSCVPLK